MSRYARALFASFMCLALPLAARASSATPAPDDAACTTFARSLEQSVAAGDPTVFDRALAIDGIVDRAVAGIGAPPELVEQFRQGARQNGISLGYAIVSAVHADGSWHLLRVHRVDGQPRALFRLLANGALNYHDLALETGPDGTLRIADVFVFMNGDWLSGTLRHGFLATAAGARPGIVKELAGRERDFAASLGRIAEMQRLHQDGRDPEALALCLALPVSLQADRFVLLQRLAIASRVNVESYAAAVEALQAAYAGDPAFDLVAIEGLFLRGRAEAALAALDRLDHTLGGDPYLKHLRGNLYFAAHENALAKQWFARAVAEDPRLSAPYWSLVSISLSEKDYDETVRLLTRIESDLGERVGNLAASPMYRDFVQSAAYAAWQKQRGGA